MLGKLLLGREGLTIFCREWRGTIRLKGNFGNTYSLLKATYDNVITVLWVCADRKLVFAQMTVHRELINLSREVLVHSLLVSIEPDTLPY